MKTTLFDPLPGQDLFRHDGHSGSCGLYSDQNKSFSSASKVFSEVIGNGSFAASSVHKDVRELHDSSAYFGVDDMGMGPVESHVKTVPAGSSSLQPDGAVILPIKKPRVSFSRRKRGPKPHKDAASSAVELSDEGVLNQIRVDNWRTLFSRQIKVLLIKNILVLIRHPILLALLLLIPPLSVFIITGPSYQVKVPTVWHDPVDIGQFDMTKRLAYYPLADPTMAAFVKYLKEAFDPPLLDDQVIGFENELACALNVSAEPDKYHASFTFELRNPKVDNISLFYVWRVSDYFKKVYADPLDPSYFDPYRAQRLTEHAITRYLLENIFISKIEGFTSDDLKYAATAIKNGRVRYDNDMSIQWLPDLEYYTDDDFSNKISTLAAPILGTSTVVLFYVFMYQLVAEKETKLRQSLHTIGMLDSAYWLSNIVIGVALSALLSVLVNVAGLLSKATYWINSPWIINFVIIWLLYFGAVSFSFVMASLLHHAQAVGFTAFLMVIVLAGLGLMTSTHRVMYPENGGFSGFWLFFPTHAFQAMFLISLKTVPFALNNMPSVPLKFTLRDVAKFTGACVSASTASVQMDKVVAETGGFYCGPEAYDCGHTVLFAILMQLAICVAQCFLAAYIDLILPAAHGASMHLWAPFTLNFWGFIRTPPPPDSHKPGYRRPQPLEGWDKDVLKQYKYVLSPPGTAEYNKVRTSSILIYDLNVTYSKFCGIKWLPAKHAVKNLSLSIPRNTIYGLLGPNGAGKSTTLSVLTGTLKPTSGYVTIEGYSIVHQRQKVSQLIGYAPQFDILWPDLTPAEHIKFFCNMRGVNYAEDLEELQRAREIVSKAGLVSSLERGKPVALETKKKNHKKWKPGEKELIFERLIDVSLQESANFPSRSLSGGMKRRLTIALACVGNPRVIFMDEPTSGLDPISRRKVWDAIQKYKLNRLIILTSHCMEETDVLSDRIGIIAKGVLRCSSNSSHLKKKYGTGYRLDMDVDEGDVLRVRDELINTYYPQAVLVGKAGGHLTLAVPKTSDSQAMCTFLQKIEGSAFIREWSIRQTTLEEVFLSIARVAERMDSVAGRS
ncbi:ATP-binding cassette protein 5 [Giardia duodenalis]|uniref:ATP-binding cassette protein 5 n=1 Tax=Giardia intestinalis (strain ATCC 50803 / WB clone C6) TaxID=184922 RepID=A8B6P7_GIAIC|nr:ATP-binding cassette protein 5 [Giardia intestinalis]KAE8301880.1 ATP-binding cassette protein 5 [Giardia intestinalis]|eukprot:XP_001709028.1 ATP-binding cassette protein 5 [Giardia lamblia ATCC 50803]